MGEVLGSLIPSHAGPDMDTERKLDREKTAERDKRTRVSEKR